MNATLRHRGPDQDGVLCADGVGLAMRRLSIIGVADGRQPLFDERGDVAVVMNGEIYNYAALRADLRARGHVFRTGSDVEVAVHLYEERGEAFVEALQGMFAYALYDRRRRVLLLGRDRLGKKPLYWAERHGVLVFGSRSRRCSPRACATTPSMRTGWRPTWPTASSPASGRCTPASPSCRRAAS
ncbi:MAG: hypothetical protein U0802_22735 [Candidatus Binatia bacterium]